MKTRKILSFTLLAVSALFITSCASQKQNTQQLVIEDIPAQKIVKNLRKVSPNYRTFEAKKVTINSEINDEKNSFRGQIKIDEHKLMLASLYKVSIPVAKIKITADSAFLVNYAQKNYIAEEYSTVLNQFMNDIKLETMLALLTGNTKSILDTWNLDNAFEASIDGNYHKLSSQLSKKTAKILEKGSPRKIDRFRRKKSWRLLTYSVWVDPITFCPIKYEVIDNETNSTAVIEYSDYIQVNKQNIPSQVSIMIDVNDKKNIIKLKYGKVEINEKLSTSFSIPSKYERVHYQFNNK